MPPDTDDPAERDEASPEASDTDTTEEGIHDAFSVSVEDVAGEVDATERPQTVAADGDGADVEAAADAAAVDPLEAAGTAGASRAELQKKLRKTHKKEAKRKHRWRRRAIWAMCTIVVLAALGAGGIYFYAKYRYDQIKKVHAKHLIVQSADPLQPFNILLVGSDSRAFVGDNQTLSSELGNEANAGGQRSDVTIVARFDPANKTVTVLSIPRDLWVDIPGNDSGISGMNRINAAFDSGPDLLVQTIEQDLGIKINHYADVNFPGFSSMVDALGGITMDFPTAVKDAYTGLDVTQTGCQQVNGVEALQLVRARHLEYVNSNGEWQYDGLSDFSRIQRQDAFFRAVLQKANASVTNPLAINDFIGAAVGNVTIDDTLTENELFDLANDFRGIPASHLITETLPTTGFVTDGGADVLKEAQPYAQNMIDAFNAIGAAPPVVPAANTSRGAKGSTTTTTTTTLPHGQVSVDVFNASSANGVAHLVAGALGTLGFSVPEIGDATTPLSGTSSQILYGPSGLQAAQTLNAVLRGPVTLVPDPSLTGSTVRLEVAGTSLIVATSSSDTGSSGAGAATTTTTTTVPTGPTTTTTTTIPSDVYANTQQEPWNPYPCTLGAAPQATPSTTTTTKAKK